MKEKIIKITKILPLFVFIALAVVYFINRKDLTVEAILTFTPDNKALAIAVMMALFAVKSLSIFMPNPVLMVALGIMFPVPYAIIISCVGYAICISIPYFIGMYSGSSQAAKLREKYKMLKYLDVAQKSNAFWMCAATRQLIFLPCDIVSLYMGAMKTKYAPYLFGSILGYLPNIAIYCILGKEVNDIGSPGFIISVSVSVVLSALSFILYIKKWKKAKKAAESTEQQ